MMNNNRNLDKDRLIERGIDELIGICRGILFDGVVVDEEAVNLAKWLNAHPHVAEKWPANTLIEPLNKALVDGSICHQYEFELVDAIERLAGGVLVNEDGQSRPVDLELFDDPLPEVYFGSVFSVTGTFRMAKRAKVEEMIIERGGIVKKDISTSTDYLVVGEVGSSAWMHTSYGRKIENAIELREKHGRIAIIPESHFKLFLLDSEQ